MKFYSCNHCKNSIIQLEKNNVSITCCGKEMEEMIPGSIEASKEKHIPKIIQKDDVTIVEVGDIKHPMTEEHYIKWIALETENGFLMQHLQNDSESKAIFQTDQKIIRAYAYCNLHGLWKKEI